LFDTQTICSHGWVKSGPMQRLVAIDVAHAPEDLLIKQQGFDLSAAGQSTGKFLARHCESVRADRWPLPPDPSNSA